MLLRRRADNREPQQRCDLPLYRIPAHFAHFAALCQVSPILLDERTRRSILTKKNRPGAGGRGGSVYRFRSG